jgi:hypothetical protein
MGKGEVELKRVLYRSWYYFRIGYATYLTFLLGLATTLTTIYYLAIANLPLDTIFPKFHYFLIFALATVFPVGASIGWLHMKRMKFYASEIDVQVESNPYYFKSTPGKELLLQWPLQYLMNVKIVELLDKEGLLSEEERNEFQAYFGMIKQLMKGESLP